MIIKPRIYLDTSVISALYDEKDFERQDITARFFEHLNNFETHLSELVIAEINDTKRQDLRLMLFNKAQEFACLKMSDQSLLLAIQYIKKGVVNNSAYKDAIHLAIATVSSVDYVVSWNFSDIVNERTKYRLRLINELNGFRAIGISSPFDLLLMI